MTETLSARFRTIGGTSMEWAADDIVPLLRELAIETDTRKFKFGDGVTAYSALPYASGVSWGGITGTLSDQADLQSALDAKEPTITAGTTGQYWRGDKSWQTLDKSAVGLGNLSNSVTGSGDSVLATNPTLNGVTISGLAVVSGDTLRITTEKTPASATATGTKGDACWDADYIYVCVSANTWKRAALSTW